MILFGVMYAILFLVGWDQLAEEVSSVAASQATQDDGDNSETREASQESSEHIYEAVEKESEFVPTDRIIHNWTCNCSTFALSKCFNALA